MTREQARRRIADAADRLLVSRRAAELTVNAIMAEAGLARTVFYRHFTDLPELILERLDELRDDVLTLPEGAEAFSEPATLRAALARTVDFFADNARLIAALDDLGRTDRQVAAAHEAFTARTSERLAALLAPNQKTTQKTSQGPNQEPDRRTYELARALTILNASYSLDFLARNPTDQRNEALDVLHLIWTRVLNPENRETQENRAE